MTDGAGPPDPLADIDPKAKRLHDLRQPLAAILAAASALRAHPDLDPDARVAFLKVIEQSAERLLEMLEAQP